MSLLVLFSSTQTNLDKLEIETDEKGERQGEEDNNE